MKIKMLSPMPGLIDGRRTPKVGTIEDVPSRVARALIRAKVAEPVRAKKPESKTK